MTSCLLVLLALSPGASALDPETVYDLDLDLQIRGAEPLQTVLHDVRPGSLPGLWVEAGEGLRYRVRVTLAEAQGVDPALDAVTFEVLIEEDRADKRGRWESAVLARPRVTTLVEEPARFTIGIDVPLDAALADQGTHIDLRLLLTAG